VIKAVQYTYSLIEKERKKERKKNYDGYLTPPPPAPIEEDRALHSMTQLSHWLHANSIPKIGCHYFWPGLLALPKNTLPNALSLVNTERKKERELKKQGAYHTMALPFTLKRILMQKEEIWKLKYFTIRRYNSQKIL